MKKITVFLLAIILLSCSSKSEIKKPEKLIEKEAMEAILFDLAVLQATRNYNSKLLSDHQIDAKKYIYQKHHIDSLQFAENNRYYASDFKEYKEMFDHVISRIEKEKAVVSKIVEKEVLAKQKKIRDSIVEASKH